MTANASKFYNHLSRKCQFPHFKKLIKGVRVSEDWKCVDVGCGTGMGTRYLAEMVSRGTVVGIDPSEDRVEEASRHAKDNITYHVAKAHDTHKLVSECDLVTCNYVMHWMMSREEKQESLNAFYRSLRPRGLVAINVMTGIAYDALHWGDQELCQMMYQHMAFNTAQTWKDMVLQAGFKKIVACEETVDESQAYDSFDDYLTMFAASWQMYYDFHHLLHKLRATVDEQKMVKWNGGKHRLVAPNLFLLLQK